MEKLCVIGIDAGTWKVIDEAIDQGKMPFMKEMKEEGAYGVLESTNPPRTCPAWPGFMTGKNPGKMGLFGFRSFDSDYGKSLNNYSDIDGLAYWDVLNQEGYSCGVLNVPVTWPPSIEDGFMVSGLLTPSAGASDEDDFAVPQELQDELDDSDFLLEPSIDDYSEEEFREKAEEILEARVDTTLELAEEREWDVMTSVIRITDPFKHKFWSEGEMQEVVDFYGEVDSNLERLINGMRELEEGLNFLFVSDHGFGRVDRKLVHFNTWLEDEGYLKFESSKTNFFMDKLPLDEIYNLITKLGVKNARNLAPQKVLQARNAFNMDINWSETEAIFDFVEETGLIYINSESRFDKGLVSEEGYESIREEIIKGLRDFEDPETGEKIVREIKTREEVYSGPYTEKGPDILFELKEGYRGRSSTGSLFSDMARGRRYAVHEPEGMILGYGPDFDSGEIEDSSIYDVAPTVLHAMDAPIPDDVDGEVLSSLFRSDSDVREREPEFRDIKSGKGSGEFSEEQEEKVKDKLADLGYMD
jgi:predicted AlkP superfamily phosphohydrolase/phosphomutase